MTKWLWHSSAAISALALAMGGSSFASAKEASSTTTSSANDPAAKASANTEEDPAAIVVTAQRRAQKLQDVPIAVTALDRQELANRLVTSISHIAHQAPNMQFYPVPGNSANTQVFARGAATPNPGFNVSESSVGFYEDDVYRGRMNISNFDFPDVERVEVLRGPQATLYGRNTLAGAVKVYSRTPGPDSWLVGSIAAGNYDTQKLAASVGGPVSDGVALSLGGVYHRQGHGFYVDESGPYGGPGNRNIGNSEQYALRGKFHWYGSDMAELTIGAEYAHETADGYNPIAIAPAIPFAPPFPDVHDLAFGQRVAKSFYGIISPFNAFSNFDLFAASANFRYNLNDNITFKSITGYYHGREANALDYKGGNYQNDGSPGEFPPGGAGSPHNEHGPASEFSEELQLLGNSSDMRLNWLLGLYYLRETGNQVFEFYAKGSDQLDPTQLQKTEHQYSTTNSYAAFAQASYELVTGLTFTGGIRYTEDHKDFTDGCVNGAGANLFNPFGTCLGSDGETGVTSWQFTQSHKFTRTDWKAGLDYKASQNFMLYASVATGFKAGGFQALCFGNEGCAAATFGPESVTSFEGGFKSTFLDGRVTFNATAYYAKYKGVQNDAELPVGTVQENVGKLDARGVELELNAAVTSTFNVFATIGTAAGHYYDLLANSHIATDSLYRIPPDMPSWTGKAGFSLDQPIDSLGGIRLLAGADVYHSALYYAQADNEMVMGPYTRANAHVGLGTADDHWSLVFSVQNLTDEETIVAGDASNATNTRAVLPPREWLFTLTYKM